MFYAFLGRKSGLIKLVTIILTIMVVNFFILQDAYSVTFVDAPGYGSEPATFGNYASFDNDVFTIPFHLGEIQNKYKGTSEKFIIHIQDAHLNYFAQKKIADIVGYINREYGMRTINLEGGSGKYDLDIFTSISSGSIREEVANYFMKKGELTGAEFYAINNPGAVDLWGIENKDLYMANLEIYRDFLPKQQETEKHLKILTSILNDLKRHIYSSEQLKIDMNYSAYKAKNMEFKDYLAFIVAEARKKRINIKKYPDIDLLIEAMGQEKRIDFKKANMERNVLIDKLKKRLSKEEVRELLSKTIGFKTQKISRRAFFSYLLRKAEEIDINPDEFSQLKAYLKYVTTYEAIDRSLVMTEMDSLESAVKNKLFINRAERKLNELSRNLVLLKTIFDFSMTKNDYLYYLKNMNSFDIANYISFIKKEAPKYRIDISLPLSITDLDIFRRDIFGFYEYSFKRDEVFMENMRFDRMKGGMEGAVIMTGGFHTENLCDLFREKGISYISIMPKFINEKGYKSPYFEMLAGGADGLQQVLRSAIVQAALLQVASKLSALGRDVWGSTDIDAFRAAVILVTAAKEDDVTIEITREGKEAIDVGDGRETVKISEFELVNMVERYENIRGRAPPAEGVINEFLTENPGIVRAEEDLIGKITYFLLIRAGNDFSKIPLKDMYQMTEFFMISPLAIIKRIEEENNMYSENKNRDWTVDFLLSFDEGLLPEYTKIRKINKEKKDINNKLLQIKFSKDEDKSAKTAKLSERSRELEERVSVLKKKSRRDELLLWTMWNDVVASEVIKDTDLEIKKDNAGWNKYTFTLNGEKYESGDRFYGDVEVITAVSENGKIIVLKKLSGTEGDEHFIMKKLEDNGDTVKTIGIIRFLDNDFADYYVLQEYAGDTLGETAEEFSADAVYENDMFLLDVADKMVKALKGMKEKGIRHYDVKPANIFYDEKGKLRISDFGISRFYIEGSNPEEKFVERRAGTPGYMSNKINTHSEKHDLFALGITLFEVMADIEADPTEQERLKGLIKKGSDKIIKELVETVKEQDLYSLEKFIIDLITTDRTVENGIWTLEDAIERFESVDMENVPDLLQEYVKGHNFTEYEDEFFDEGYPSAENIANILLEGTEYVPQDISIENLVELSDLLGIRLIVMYRNIFNALLEKDKDAFEEAFYGEKAIRWVVDLLLRIDLADDRIGNAVGILSNEIEDVIAYGFGLTEEESDEIIDLLGSVADDLQGYLETIKEGEEELLSEIEEKVWAAYEKGEDLELAPDEKLSLRYTAARDDDMGARAEAAIFFQDKRGEREGLEESQYTGLIDSLERYLGLRERGPPAADEGVDPVLMYGKREGGTSGYHYTAKDESRKAELVALLLEKEKFKGKKVPEVIGRFAADEVAISLLVSGTEQDISDMVGAFMFEEKNGIVSGISLIDMHAAAGFLGISSFMLFESIEKSAGEFTEDDAGWEINALLSIDFRDVKAPDIENFFDGDRNRYQETMDMAMGDILTRGYETVKEVKTVGPLWNKIYSIRYLAKLKKHIDPSFSITPRPRLKYVELAGKGENYRIGVPIGKGFFSIIYEAVPLKGDGERIVYKQLKLGEKDADSVAFFMKEILLSQKMEDANNVILVLGSGVYEDDAGANLFMVMEFAGKTIKEQSEELKKLSVENKFILAENFLKGINALNKNRIQHRDLRPPNIFWDKETNDVKIGDLGIARYRPDTVDAYIAHGGSPKENIGHDIFLPESFLLKNDNSEKVDLFAFAMTLLFVEDVERCNSDFFVLNGKLIIDEMSFSGEEAIRRMINKRTEKIKNMKKEALAAEDNFLLFIANLMSENKSDTDSLWTIEQAMDGLNKLAGWPSHEEFVGLMVGKVAEQEARKPSERNTNAFKEKEINDLEGLSDREDIVGYKASIVLLYYKGLLANVEATVKVDRQRLAEESVNHLVRLMELRGEENKEEKAELDKYIDLKKRNPDFIDEIGAVEKLIEEGEFRGAIKMLSIMQDIIIDSDILAWAVAEIVKRNANGRMAVAEAEDIVRKEEAATSKTPGTLTPEIETSVLKDIVKRAGTKGKTYTSGSPDVKKTNKLLSSLAKNRDLSEEERSVLAGSKIQEVRVIAMDFEQLPDVRYANEIEALSYEDKGELVVLINSSGGIASDYLDNRAALRHLIRHEFMEAVLGVSHRDIKRLEMKENDNNALTVLNELMIKHMIPEQLDNIKRDHENDPGNIFYDAVQTEIIVRADRGVLGTTRPGKYMNVVLVPLTEGQEFYDGSKYSTLKNKSKSVLSKDYGINTYVVYYNMDAGESELKDMIQKEVDAKLSRIKGFQDETRARIIAFSSEAKEDMLRKVLAKYDKENKLAGIVKGEFRPDTDAQRFSIVSLLTLGIGLNEWHRVDAAGKPSEEDLKKKLAERIQTLLLTLGDYPAASSIRGENVNSIVKNLLEGLEIMRVKKINYNEIRDFMEAESAVLESL